MKGRKRKITGILLVLVICIGTASQSGAVTIDEAEKKADQLESDKKKAEEEKKTLSEKLAANAANHVADTKNIHSGFTFLWRSSGRPGSRRENLKMGQSAGRKSLSPRK